MVSRKHIWLAKEFILLNDFKSLTSLLESYQAIPLRIDFGVRHTIVIEKQLILSLSDHGFELLKFSLVNNKVEAIEFLLNYIQVEYIKSYDNKPNETYLTSIKLDIEEFQKLLKVTVETNTFHARLNELILLFSSNAEYDVFFQNEIILKMMTEALGQSAIDARMAIIAKAVEDNAAMNTEIKKEFIKYIFTELVRELPEQLPYFEKLMTDVIEQGIKDDYLELILTIPFAVEVLAGNKLLNKNAMSVIPNYELYGEKIFPKTKFLIDSVVYRVLFFDLEKTHIDYLPQEKNSSQLAKKI